MFEVPAGAPFVVLKRDLWLVDPASAKGAPAPGDLAARLAARRVFGLDALPEGFSAVAHVKHEWDWSGKFPTTDRITLHIVVEPPARTGSFAFFVGWTTADTSLGAAAPLRSPESLRMAFPDLIPTYREEFKRQCLYRHRVRAEAAEREKGEGRGR